MEEKKQNILDTQEQKLSALESINASFAAMKKDASKYQKERESVNVRKEGLHALDEINASFAEKRGKLKAPAENEKAVGSRISLMWNLVSGVLILIIIISTVALVSMVYRGTGEREEVQTGETSVTQNTGDTEQNPDRTGETGETEQNPEETAETGETEPNSEETGETGETEQTEKQTEAVSESNGIRYTIPEEYEDILTEKEKEKWRTREKDPSRLFVQINQKMEITDRENVYLRLINPPYSALKIQVKIYMKEEPDTVLYQSDIVEPGTVLEYVPFAQVPEDGEHAAEVEYTVYDEEGNRLGTHKMAIDITVKSN